MSYANNRVIKAIKSIFTQRDLIAKQKITFIGEDRINKYYETERPSHGRRFQRYYERKSLEEIKDIIDLVGVPPAWDAWLRFRRKDPPTNEELKESEEYFRIQQQRARESKTSLPSQIQDPKLPKKRNFPKLPYE